MARKANQKRRKGATDQGESTGRVESLENVSKASDDIPRQLRSKKIQGSTHLGESVQEGIDANILITEVAVSGSVLPPNHIVGVDAASKLAESSQIVNTGSPPLLGDPVQEQATDDLVTAEIAGSPIKEGNIPTTELALPPTEEYTDIDVYHPPFTIYQRFIPDKNWNVDSKVSTPCNIFPDTGERRKKEVKDNFDWLQPAIRPADKSAARQAYVENYSFKDGFHISDKSASYSKYSIPAMITSSCANFTTSTMPMDHPFCNVEQATAWLTKPVGHLLNRIHAATQRTHIRSSLKDACLGQDLFICSAYVTTNEFITTSDDIELIDRYNR